jgi:hypothetical protein
VPSVQRGGRDAAPAIADTIRCAVVAGSADEMAGMAAALSHAITCVESERQAAVADDLSRHPDGQPLTDAEWAAELASLHAALAVKFGAAAAADLARPAGGVAA